MELSGIRVGRRSSAMLAALHDRAKPSALTYGHPGSTLTPGSPAGVPDRSYSIAVAGDLEVARAALRRWAPHEGLRASIHPSGAELTEGATILVVAALGPIEMVVPNRIVVVVDEEDRFGFAYGSLPGHPEAGEELFLAERRAGGGTRLTVRVQARPATTLARLGGPALVVLQRAAAGRYLRAWSSAIDS